MMCVKRLVLAAATSGMLLTSANAAVFMPIADLGDYEALSNASTSTGTSTFLRVGLRSATGPSFASAILPFALPAIPAGEEIIGATLTVEVLGATTNLPTANADLYGLPFDPGPAVDATSANYYSGPFSSTTTTGAEALQDDYLVIADASVPGSTPKTSIDIQAYIESLYTAGAVAGDFATLRISYDATPGLTGNRYQVQAAGTTGPDPFADAAFLTITTAPIPEPAMAGLALIGGVGVLLRRRRA